MVAKSYEGDKMTEEELQEYNRKEKKRNYMRQYYETHPEAYEKKREADRKRIAANRDSENERVKTYYASNQEKVKRRAARHQLKYKLKAIALLGGKCKCGESHPAALQFHHKDPNTKLFPVTTKQMTTPKRFPWDMIIEEVKKCELLCSNCHAKHHSAWTDEDIIELQGWWNE
jgi:hypothetical protein